MRVGLKLRPGQRGTRKLLAEYGDRLLSVRYRYDEQTARRLKTVELIVDEAPWRPRRTRPARDEIVGVSVKWGEVELGRRIRWAGGNWNAKRRLWELEYQRALALGLAERVVRLTPPDASLQEQKPATPVPEASTGAKGSRPNARHL